ESWGEVFGGVCVGGRRSDGGVETGGATTHSIMEATRKVVKNLFLAPAVDGCVRYHSEKMAVSFTFRGFRLVLQPDSVRPRATAADQTRPDFPLVWFRGRGSLITR